MNKTKRMLEWERLSGEAIEKTIRRLYYDEQKSQKEIGEFIGGKCIGSWMKRLGIKTRTPKDRSRRKRRWEDR